MKRLHVHSRVADVEASVAYYSKFFGQAPDVRKDDYAKWLLDDPQVNFAISNEPGHASGIEHLGFHFDTKEEFEAFRSEDARAPLGRTDEDGTTCCYANSDKAWFTDPDNVPWETFFTFGESDTYHGLDTPAGAAGMPDMTHQASAGTCCVPD
ncbi:MAG: ArsI/CadI family heavy metal resistance metalloenzyme [Alphaproteobacteria bacterium]